MSVADPRELERQLRLRPTACAGLERPPAAALFRTGITSVVPWLVVSESGHAGRIVSARRDGCSAPEAAASRAR